MTIKIKLCGITSRNDLELIAQEGADYGGVICGIPQSPRNLSLEDARSICLNPPLPLINLTFHQSLEENLLVINTLQPSALQLQGEESPESVAALKQRVSCEIWKVLHLPPKEEEQKNDLEGILARAREFIDAGTDRFMIDASAILGGKRRFGGTGKTVDWDAAHILCLKIPAPVFLAGGLKPENVADAIRIVQPFGIDLCSGTELEKGIKNPGLVRQLIRNARSS